MRRQPKATVVYRRRRLCLISSFTNYLVFIVKRWQYFNETTTFWSQLDFESWLIHAMLGEAGQVGGLSVFKITMSIYSAFIDCVAIWHTLLGLALNQGAVAAGFYHLRSVNRLFFAEGF